MTGQCLYFTRYLPTLSGGGGSRRLMQVLEVLSPLDPQVVSLAAKDRIDDETFAQLDKRQRRWTQKFRLARGEYRMWRHHRRAPSFRLDFLARAWANNLELDGVGLVLVDDPLYFRPLVHKAVTAGIPVIALLQNLEALVHDNVVPRYQETLLQKELEVLAACDRVVTISREETFLLKNFDRPVHLLPYYPPQKILERMQAIRQKREQGGPRENYLLVGSAANHCTRRGMEILIELWQKKGAAGFGGRLLVGGFKTDTLLGHIRWNPDVEFLGPLSDAALDEHTARVKACICYQDKGGGALTRICEMMLAGVPVLANSHAARSYYHMEGVVEFSRLDDLAAAAREIEKLADHIPVPSRPHTDEWLPTLTGLCQKK